MPAHHLTQIHKDNRSNYGARKRARAFKSLSRRQTSRRQQLSGNTLTAGQLDSIRGASGGMTEPLTKQRITRVSRHMKARRSDVYKALVDQDSVASWLAPGTMRCVVHEFEPREGGRFRMSLTYQDPTDGPEGKTTRDTDTFHGRFVQLIPYEHVVQLVEFESEQPSMSGKMRVTWDLADAGGGTNVTVVCEDIPRGVRLEDNEAGSASSLQKLARLVEKPAL